MSVPYWIQDAIFYQIFPDRFANADLNIDPPNVLPWNALPTERGFFGGDLRGIIEKFDYLLDLGINAIYLNPIFLSPSIHRYNITDYMRIDPRLGDLADFHALIELAHRNDVRVIVDGVFNHCGRGFFAFNDLLENQADSPYKDWFHVKNFPIDAYSPGDAEEYIGWWNLKSMPKFNTGNPAVRKYLLNVARYWIEQGADGWRLDVPNEIDDDTFWAEFRHTVRQANRDAYLLGEIWDVNPRWVGAEHFDGLMNYPMREALFSFLMEKNKASQFASNLDRLLKAYPRQNVYAMFLPLGTHDTERIMYMLGGNLKKVQLAFMFQFAFLGAPSIYYGDEIGLDGGKDPDNRRPFPWDQKQWKTDLRVLVQRLAAERRRSSALRRGDFLSLFVDDKRGVFVFARRLGSETVIVALNASATRRSFYLPVDALGIKDGHILRDLIGGGELIVSESSLSINMPAWSGLWLG